jgi:hypothetical protein
MRTQPTRIGIGVQPCSQDEYGAKEHALAQIRKGLAVSRMWMAAQGACLHLTIHSSNCVNG